MLPSSQLFDESALPSWLSTASEPFPGPSAAARPPAGNAPWGHNAGPPSASPFNVAGGTYGLPSGASASAVPTAGGTGGLPGQSLIDTSALPQWLGGHAGEREPAAREQALGGDGMRAHSLVDERALPLWLRQEPSTSADAPAPGAVSQWLASPATDEPLPTWLNQVYAAAQVPRVPVANPVAAPWESPAAGTPPSLGTMSGSQLLDDAALPDWLQAAGAAGGLSAFPAAAPLPTQGQPAGPSGPFGAPTGGAVGAGIGIPAGNQPFAFGGVVPLVSPSESLDWNSGRLAGPASPAGSQPSTALGGYPDFSGQSSGQAGPAASPLSASLQSRGGSGSLAFPAGPPTSADAGGERFSASDLIDPDMLPAWVHQQEPASERVFSSTQGWTNKQPSASPGYSASAASGQVPAASGWFEGRSAAAAAPLDEGNLPPWLRRAGAPAGYGASEGDEMQGSGRWGRVGVPASELPPWLGGGTGSSGGNPNGRPYEAGEGAPWGWRGDAPSAGWGADAGAGAAQPPSSGYPGGWDGQAAGGAEPTTHYADRFRDEVPGARRPFGYAFDHGAIPEDSQPDTYEGAGQPAWDDQRKSSRRKRWFGRK